MNEVSNSNDVYSVSVNFMFSLSLWVSGLCLHFGVFVLTLVLICTVHTYAVLCCAMPCFRLFPLKMKWKKKHIWIWVQQLKCVYLSKFSWKLYKVEADALFCCCKLAYLVWMRKKYWFGFYIEKYMNAICWFLLIFFHEFVLWTFMISMVFYVFFILNIYWTVFYRN